MTRLHAYLALILTSAILLAQGGLAEDAPAGPPTNRDLVERCRPGDYRKLRLTLRQGDVVMVRSIWEKYVGVEGDEIQVLQGIASFEGPFAFPWEEIPQIPVKEGSFPMDQPLVAFEPTEEMKVTAITRSIYTEREDVDVEVDGRTYPCRELKLVTECTIETGPATNINVLYLCDAVPMGGMVKMEDIWTGAVQRHDTMELTGFAGMAGWGMESGSMAWLTDTALVAAHDSVIWPNHGGKTDAMGSLNLGFFQSRLAESLAWAGEFDLATKVVEGVEIENAAKAGRRGLSLASLYADKLEARPTRSQLAVSLVRERADFVGEMPLEELVRLAKQGESVRYYGPAMLFPIVDLLVRARRFEDLWAFLATVDDTQVRSELRGRALGAARALDPAPVAFIETLWRERGEQPSIALSTEYLTWLQQTGATDRVPDLATQLLAELGAVDYGQGSNIGKARMACQLLWDLRHPSAVEAFRTVGEGTRRARLARLDGKPGDKWDLRELLEVTAQAGKPAETLVLFERYIKAGGAVDLVADAIVNLYKAGYPNEALAWLDGLTPPETDLFRFTDAVARVYYHIARHEGRVLGNADAARAYQEMAIARMTQAEAEITDFLKVPSLRATHGSWRMMSGYDREVPIEYHTNASALMVRDLLAEGRFLEAVDIAAIVGDHQPHSNYRDDLWRVCLIETALGGDIKTLRAALARWPGAPDYHRPQSVDLIIQALAHAGNIEAAVTQAETMVHPAGQARLLSLVLIELANQGQIAAAQALLPALWRAQASLPARRPYPVQAAYLAIARAQAKAGDYNAARASMLFPRWPTCLNLSDSGLFNGRTGEAVVMEIAWFAVLHGATAKEMADWQNALPQDALKRCFAMGVIMGRSGLPVSETYLGPNDRTTDWGF